MDKNKNPVQTLMDKSYWIVVSKPVAKILGMETAIVIGELCSLSNYFGNKEFFFPIEKIVKNTCLTRYSVLQALKKLKEYKILSVSKRGLPAKNYYTVCSEELSKIIDAGMDAIRVEETDNSENSQEDDEAELTDETHEVEPQEVSNSTQSCPSTDRKLSEFDTTVSLNLTPLLEKEEEKEEREGIPNNLSADETAEAKSEKPKRIPLIEREPKNDLERIEKAYLLNYKELYEKHILRLKEPPINWPRAKKQENEMLEKFGLDNVLMAIRQSKDDEFCVQGGYVLTTILGSGVFSRLVNSNDWHKHKGNQKMREQDMKPIEILF